LQPLAENPSPLTSGAPISREKEPIALLLRPGGLIDLWDERWEELTGLRHRDVAGICTELFLDWLFPRQLDRSFVADLFHQPGRHGAQAMLQVAGRTANRLLFFTFLPVRALDLRAGLPATDKAKASLRGSALMPVGDAWLIVASPREVTAIGEGRAQRFCKAKASQAAAPVIVSDRAANRSRPEGT
jgi:hypothetical protein